MADVLDMTEQEQIWYLDRLGKQLEEEGRKKNRELKALFGG